jgi:hypothetical protein
VSVEEQQSGSRLYERYLREQGYVPQVDDVGNVYFKYEGGIYCILIDAEDPNFFHLTYPNFYPLDTPEECERTCCGRAYKR